MKARIILTDCDGCLVDWNKGFESHMEAKGYPKIPGTDDKYSLAARHGIEISKAFAFVKEFNEGSKIADLEPFADSVEYVKKLAALNFRFIVVTSISDAPQAKYYRTKNLHNLFGEVFEEVHCLKQGISKGYELMRWSGSGYFWVEDHMRQAEAGHEVGLKTVLINHPYNTHYKTDLFPIVSYSTPWKEIYEMVKEEYHL